MLPTAGRGHGAFTRANDSAGRSTSLHARASPASRCGLATSPLQSPTHRSQANLRQSMTNLLTKIVALGALVLLLGASHSLAADTQVKIANFTFDPPTLTVKAGTTVTWVNAD